MAPLDWPEISRLAQILGFGIVVFVMWIMTIKFFIYVLKSREENSRRIEDALTKRNDENFQVLNKFAEDLEFNSGRLSDLSSKIDNNTYCPLVRERKT